MGYVLVYMHKLNEHKKLLMSGRTRPRYFGVCVLLWWERLKRCRNLCNASKLSNVTHPSKAAANV